MRAGIRTASRHRAKQSVAWNDDLSMGILSWIAVAAASIVGVAIVSLWRSGERRQSVPDVDAVSDAWLAEQRRGNDS